MFLKHLYIERGYLFLKNYNVNEAKKNFKLSLELDESC